MGQRLVDANALKETIVDVLTDIKHIIGIYDTLFDSVINTVCNVIDDAHAIDIVRCKDCKHGLKYPDGEILCVPHYDWCDDDHFCQFGEREDGDSHE
jgi:hypothetical protein